MKILGVSFYLDGEYSTCMIDNGEMKSLFHCRDNPSDKGVIYRDAKNMNVDVIVVDVSDLTGNLAYNYLKNISKDIKIEKQSLNKLEKSKVIQTLQYKDRLICDLDLHTIVNADGIVSIDSDKYNSHDLLEILSIITAYGYYNKITSENNSLREDEVYIYFGYENQKDLVEKINIMINIFNEEIINDLNVDIDENIVSIKTFKQITQKEIIDLFVEFETDNIDINYLGEVLWINIDEVL